MSVDCKFSISSIILWIIALIVATVGAFICHQWGNYVGIAVELCLMCLDGIMIAQTVEEYIEKLDKNNNTLVE